MKFSAMLALIVALLAGSAVAGERKVVIDTLGETLLVLDGGRVIARFDGISVGRAGTALLRRRGDNTTPLGRFRIAWINRQSRFRLFFGFDYPNRPVAQRALEAGLIDRATFDAIVTAIDAGRIPPQNTPLGGYLGIHGLGHGDPLIHARMNWTEGCIALDNAQIEALAKLIGIGTEVVVGEGVAKQMVAALGRP